MMFQMKVHIAIPDAYPTLLCLLLCYGPALALAHGVHHRIEAGNAVVITLTYANGKPFANQKYALTPVGQEKPRQLGNTDASGRIAFVPDAITDWRLQATAADGHGLKREFVLPPPSPAPPPAALPASPASAVPAAAPAQATPTLSAVPASETPPRWMMAVSGLSLIFGLFGLYQLFVRRPH